MPEATARAPGELITKTVTAKATATSGGFQALVARFGNLDSQGDIVQPGAFAKSLAERGDRPLPVVWSHNTYDPAAYVGKATATETDEGLLVDAEFFDTDTAQHVRRLMDEGVVVEFSFQGRVMDGDLIKIDDPDGGERYAFALTEIDLWEVGPTLIGANRETELLSVKALTDRLATSQGRELARRHVETLKSIHESLGGVIDAAEVPPPTPCDEEEGPVAAALPGAPPPADDGGTTQKAEGTTPPAFAIPARVLLELAAPIRTTKER